MEPADDSVTLPVPETVVACYLVPTADPALDPALEPGNVLAAADGRFAGTLGELITAARSAPNPPVAVHPLTDLPPLPLDLFAALGATDAQLDRLETATHVVQLTAGSLPGWPALHEWVTRALAVVSAERLGADVVDVLDQRVLAPAGLEASLPDARGRVCLADWVTVAYSPGDDGGYWCTTTGLRRYGLPELQTLSAPGPAVQAWGQVMTALAGRLIAAWRAALIIEEGAAFVQLPAGLTITASDVADAYARTAGPRGPRTRPQLDTPDPSINVRIALDPSVPGDPTGIEAFLTVLPPLDWSGPAGEHIVTACRTLLGGRALNRD